jgi:hypothetical protein
MRESDVSRGSVSEHSAQNRVDLINNPTRQIPQEIIYPWRDHRRQGTAAISKMPRNVREFNVGLWRHYVDLDVVGLLDMRRMGGSYAEKDAQYQSKSENAPLE